MEKALGPIKFFNEYKQKMTQENFRLLLSCIEFESMKIGEVVCHYGEIGKKFYVIIEGSVSIVVKNKVEGDQKENKKPEMSEKELKEREQSLLHVEDKQLSIEQLIEAFPGFHPSGELS